MSTNELFSLQGIVRSGIRNPTTGRPGALTDLGNVSKAESTLTPTISDKYDSRSGLRILIGRLMKERKGELNMTMDEFTLENLALGLFGAKVPVVGGTVTAEVFPAGLVVGNSVALDKQGVSALVITDSSVGPVTLEAGVDYKLTGSVVTMLTVTGTQPFKAAYTYAAQTIITMMTSVAPPERYIVFDGLDTNTGTAVHAELYRVQFMPAKTFNLIDADWGGLDLTAAVLYDELNASDTEFGGFGRVVKTPAA
jgi:hypothetical protein